MSVDKNIIWSPVEYMKAAVIAREIQDEMMGRLPLLALKPKLILDAGCGAGESARALQNYFPQSFVMALDQSMPMLEHAKKTHLTCVCATAEMLPLANHSVDFIFANLLLPWINDQKKIFSEWKRVLKANGLLMFSAFGLDTLRECKNNLSTRLIDMHDLGDAMLAAGFSDPVLDVNYFTLSYRNIEKLRAELFATGMMTETAEIPAAADGTYQVTYETIIAHAFAPIAAEPATREFKIPVSSLKKNEGTNT